MKQNTKDNTGRGHKFRGPFHSHPPFSYIFCSHVLFSGLFLYSSIHPFSSFDRFSGCIRSILFAFSTVFRQFRPSFPEMHVIPQSPGHTVYVRKIRSAAQTPGPCPEQPQIVQPYLLLKVLRGRDYAEAYIGRGRKPAEAARTMAQAGYSLRCTDRSELFPGTDGSQTGPQTERIRTGPEYARKNRQKER